MNERKEWLTSFLETRKENRRQGLNEVRYSLVNIVVVIIVRVLLSSGGGGRGKLPPQTSQLPP